MTSGKITYQIKKNFFYCQLFYRFVVLKITGNKVEG